MRAALRRAIRRCGPSPLHPVKLAYTSIRADGSLEVHVAGPAAAALVDRALAEEALDALAGEDADPAVAEELLRQALGR